MNNPPDVEAAYAAEKHVREIAPSGRSSGSRLAGGLSGPLAAHYLLLGVTGLLLALGLVMVLSASSVTAYEQMGSPFAVVSKQLVWAGFGLVLLIVAGRCSPRTLRRFGYPLLLVSTIGLAVVLAPGLGSAAHGASRWVPIGGLRFQPSEPAKLALALWGADLLARKGRLLRQSKHLLVPILPVGAALAALVLAEPDMGTMMVLMAELFGLLFVVGTPGRLLSLLGGLAVAAGVVMAISAPYRMARLTSFAHPFADPTGAGYQSVQGLYALSTGGWWGVGLGASRQKWGGLPNADTDFIFAIIGEELGLIGGLTVLLLFGLLGYAGARIAIATTDTFSRLAASAITTWIVVQALLNIGAVTAVLPITGVPLPFISVGGSSLAVTLLAVGVLLSINRRTPSFVAARAARQRR